jgi:hypothetical protein
VRSLSANASDFDVDRLNWSNYCDAGYDVMFHQYRIDIKTVGYGRHFLIWPVNKRHFYLETRFNALVLVKEAAPRFLIDKWISRDGFYCERCQADGQFPNSSITPGTWFIKDSQLWDIDDLCRLAGHAIPAPTMTATDAIAEGKGFEWVTGRLS